VSLTTQAIGTN